MEKLLSDPMWKNRSVQRYSWECTSEPSDFREQNRPTASTTVIWNLSLHLHWGYIPQKLDPANEWWSRDSQEGPFLRDIDLSCHCPLSGFVESHSMPAQLRVHLSWPLCRFLELFLYTAPASPVHKPTNSSYLIFPELWPTQQTACHVLLGFPFLALWCRK